MPLNEAIQLKTREVLEVHPKLTGTGGGRNHADPFVIALAMTYEDGVVVTEETLTGNIVKPRIPDVCDAMNIRRLNLIGFVTEQGWSF